MHLLPILAATDKAPTSVLDALPHLTGMVMVIFTLVTLWGVCVITAKVIHIMNLVRPPAPVPAPVSAPATAQSATPAEPTPTAGIPPEIVAVIAAAVATVTGKSHRILSIKPMSSGWERAGRQSVLISHRIR